MSVYEMAKKYYPRLWDKQRIQQLAEAGRLTAAEAAEILDGKEKEETVWATDTAAH